MYNNIDTLIFNAPQATPYQLPPPGRVGMFAFTDNLIVVIDSNGNVVDLLAQGRTNAVGNLDTAGTFDLADGTFVTATLAANTAITFANPPAQGGSFDALLTNFGAFTPTWPASVVWAGGTEPTWTAAGIDHARFTTFDGGVTWVGTAVALNVS